MFSSLFFFIQGLFSHSNHGRGVVCACVSLQNLNLSIVLQRGEQLSKYIVVMSILIRIADSHFHRFVTQYHRYLSPLYLTILICTISFAHWTCFSVLHRPECLRISQLDVHDIVYFTVSDIRWKTLFR